MTEQHAGKNGERGPGGHYVRSWYDVLEVARDATSSEIEAAYKRAIRLIEGKSLGGYLMLDQSAQESARHDVETAFLVLSDPDERARFDSLLDEQEHKKDMKKGRARDSSSSYAVAPPLLPPKPAVPVDVPRKKPQLRFLSPQDESQPKAKPVEAPAPEAPREERAKKPWQYGDAGTEGVAERPRVIEERSPYEPEEEALPPEGEINGGVLRRLRELRGMTLEELAEQTHIRRPYLKAIEDQNLDELPARVYLRGFLTQVARVLRVDKKRLAEGYIAFVERYRGH